MLGHTITRRNLTTQGRTRLQFAAVAIAALSMVFGGCGSESGAETLTFQTWNAGLAYNFVPLAKERREAVFEAIKSSKADVLCLQEVWVDDDLSAIDAAAKEAGFQTSFHHETPEDTAGLPIACTAGDTTELEPCAQKNCGKEAVGQLVGCVQTKCASQLAAISPQCLTCLASNLDKDLSGILSACAKGGGTYSFGGYNGLMLLTRKKATKTEHTFLKSSLVRRSVLRASIQVGEGDGAATLDTWCTHLTARLSAINYPGEFSGYEEEQAQQIDTLIKLVKGGSNFVVMGDMNTSKAVGTSILAELPDNYAKFEAAGWQAPYVASETSTCTYCGDNTLVSSGADKGGEGAIIDHVFVDPAFTTSAPRRLYDGQVDVTFGGKTEKSHISDHFGVAVDAEIRFGEE